MHGIMNVVFNQDRQNLIFGGTSFHHITSTNHQIDKQASQPSLGTCRQVDESTLPGVSLNRTLLVLEIAEADRESCSNSKKRLQLPQNFRDFLEKTFWKKFLRKRSQHTGRALQTARSEGGTKNYSDKNLTTHCSVRPRMVRVDEFRAS